MYCYRCGATTNVYRISPRMYRLLSVFLARGSLLFCLLGALLLPFFFLQPQHFQSYSWPTTIGTVGSTSYQLRPVTRARSLYYANVCYQYMYASQPYTQCTIECHSNTSFWREESAIAFLAQYPVQARVTVSVDPRDPTYACLLPAPTLDFYIYRFWWFLCIGTTLLWVIPFGIAYVQRKRNASPERKRRL
ncbi:MAG: DUF3592 domain-containing protein [Blastochloris sp.]|nr:DUF3592 domain-containing protein [Blastochloris sp.]